MSIRVDKADERLDRAAQIVGQLQQRLGTVERKLERKLEPDAHVTDEQAAEISDRVKALAQLLSQHEPYKNHYQAIFGESYRRFRASSSGSGQGSE